MSTLGINDLKQLALPTYIDAAYLERVRLESGETYGQLLNDIATGLSIANGSLLSDPLTASLVSLTTEISTEYAVGTSGGFQAHTEYSRPDQKRGNTTGHMLPLDPFDRGLGWTWDFLQRARRPQIDADIASAMADVHSLYRKAVLTRIFKNTYTAVGTGAGRSQPFADGGTADATYVPIATPDRGGTFLYTHNHITFQNGFTQAFVEVAVRNLWEHGYDAPYDMVVSATDMASWTDTSNVTGWVPKASELIRYGMTADLASLGDEFVGAIDTAYGVVRVRATSRIPTLYWAVYKSFGALDQRNPLQVRYDPKFGVGAVLLPSDMGIREYPFENAILYARFGVGVANRVGAVAYKVAGSYTIPTIT